MYYSYICIIHIIVSWKEKKSELKKAKIKKNLGGFIFANEPFEKFRADLISRTSYPKRFREFFFRENGENSRNREI